MFEKWLRERMCTYFDSRYGGRDNRFVHVHELLQPAATIASLRRSMRRDDRLGYLVVGEAFENGLAAMLRASKPSRAYRVVKAPRRMVPDSVLAALREAGVGVREREGQLVIPIDGQTDLVVPDDPEGMTIWELKTTRSSREREYKNKWRIQAALYAWLYRRPVRLVIVNINDGVFEPVSEVYEPDEGWAACYIGEWLRGSLWPWSGCPLLPRRR